MADTSTPHLVIESGPESSREFIVPETGARIGRANENDFKISDPSMSRFQSRVFFRDGCLWVSDLGSTNETLINNKPVQECQLRAGDRIEIGEVVIKVERTRLNPADPEPAKEEPVQGTHVSTVDLGLGPANPPVIPPAQGDTSKKTSDRKHAPTILWVLAATLLFGAIAAAAFKVLTVQTAETAARPSAGNPPVSFYYEYEKASRNNSQWYKVTLIGQQLTLKMRDIQSQRNISQSSSLEEDELKTLFERLNQTTIMNALPVYNSLEQNFYKSEHLIIALEDRCKTTVSYNHSDPPADVRQAIDIISEFANNKFDVDPIDMSHEQMRATAQENFAMAEDYFEADSTGGINMNLWNAYKKYSSACRLVKTFEPKPDMYNRALSQRSECLKTLTGRLSSYFREALQAEKLGHFDEAHTQLNNMENSVEIRHRTFKDEFQKLRDLRAKLNK